MSTVTHSLHASPPLSQQTFGVWTPAFGQQNKSIQLHMATQPAFGQSSVVITGGQRREIGLLRGLSGVFRPAAEVFIAGIMVVDVFAMWLPRVLGALFRGANKESAPSDSRWEKAQKYLSNLNWGNAWEETWREICSGPALFFWPTIIFSLARKGFGGHALEIKQPLLEDLSNRLVRHLPSHPAKEGPPKEQLSQAWQQLLTETLSPAHQDSPSLKAFLTQWSKDFTQLLQSKPNISSKKIYQQQLKHLYQKLENAVVQHNRNHYAQERFYQYDQLPAKLGKTAGLTKTSSLFNTLTNFYGLVRGVEKKSAQSSSTSLAQHIKRGYQHLIKAKALYSFLSVGITLAFLSRLVFWSQKTEKYPANRNLPLFSQEPSQSPVASSSINASISPSLIEPPSLPAAIPLTVPAFDIWASAQ